METTDQLTSSKILEVLCQISARLEAIDRRLQVSRPALPAEDRETSPLLESRVLTQDYGSFRIRTCLDEVGRAYIEEIVFPPGPLLHLIQTLSSVCPHHPIAGNEITYMFPFTEIMGQWEILRIIRGHTTPSASGFLRTVCPKGEHVGLERDVGELLDCIEKSANCGPSIKDRCTQLDKGRVSFVHLPDIFARGAIISSNSNENGYQVVEVVSCEINSTSASGDACEVLFWYFRWSRRALIKYNGRFEVQQYGGTRRLKDLPFSPIATYSNTGETIEGYHASLESGGEALSFLKSLPSHEREPYPRFLHTQNILGQSGEKPNIVIIDDPELIHYPSNMVRINMSPEMRCTCDAEIKPSEIDRAFSSSRYCLLAPARLDAFDLLSKKWIKVETTSLQSIPYTPIGAALEGLEVNTAVKLSLDLEVRTYIKQRQHYYDQLHDFVGVNMPTGLSYHFQGPSGVGKTLLAEVLAESYRLPLMSFRLTEFGLELSIIGEHLKELMHLSSRWGALLFITEADGLLQARRLYDNITRGAMMAELIDSLASYHGIIIFCTSEIAQVDKALKDKLRPVAFSSLSAEQMVHIFKACLKRAHRSGLDSGTEIEMLNWFQDVITDWAPSGREIRDLVRTSFDQAVSQSKQVQLGDLVAAYTAKTGSLNFWDFDTEAASYADDSLADDSESTLILNNRLSKEFGDICAIPDDGRVSLTFSKSFLQSLPSEHAFQHIDKIQALYRQLRQFGGLRVFDWGWPRQRWSPQIGCMYELEANGSSQPDLDIPKTKWERTGFTFGLQSLLHSTDTYLGIGRPWRRFIIFEGIAPVIKRSRVSIKERTSSEYNILPNFPWLSLENMDDITHLFDESLFVHARAEPMKLQGLSTSDKLISQKNSFHIVFYELLLVGDRHTSGNVVPFYGDKSCYLRKSAFTLLHIPLAEPAPLDDPIHWTMLCLVSPDFGLTEQCCRMSESPSLRAQSLHYVANALGLVASHWRGVLQQLNRIVDNRSVLHDPNRLQDILFDDNTFSISKRYFWAINLIHEIISLLDDSLEKWESYKRASVAPFLERYGGETDEDWEKKAYAAMLRNDEEAMEACGELELLRDAFQETLKRITLMRDGLFNASSVMEARASTQLGENVKLLTFISIFFLPPGLCMAIWSINETYDRRDLAIVTTVVAVTTYFVTLNLNNLIFILHKLYAPRRLALVEEMEKDPNWNSMGNRFKAYQRPQPGEHEPSEWMVMVFSLRKVLRPVIDFVVGLFRSSGPGRKEPDGV